MLDNVTTIEKLFDKAEEYSVTTIELLRLEAIKKSSDVISSVLSKIVIIVSVALSILILNIGLALWLGKLAGENYYGFFIVAGVHLIIGLLVYTFRNSWIKIPITNKIIAKMMQEKL
jgi:hypothetical protein